MSGKISNTNRPAAPFPQDWPIYAERTRWPEAAGLVFLPNAVDVLGEALWGSADVDLHRGRSALEAKGAPLDETGVLCDLARFFARLFVDGALTTFARPVDGQGTTPLGSDAWDRDDALAAVATGILSLPDPQGVGQPHWVFLDRDEVDLLLLVHSPAGGDPDDAVQNLFLRHERMADIVTANLPAIAATRRYKGFARGDASAVRRRNGTDPTREELDEMFADAPRVLQPRHQIALERHVATWLLAHFDRDRRNLLRKVDFRQKAMEAYQPYLTHTLFRSAWRDAVRDAPSRAGSGRPEKRDDPEPPTP